MMNAVRFSSALYKTLCMESRQRAIYDENALVLEIGHIDPDRGGNVPLPDIENDQEKGKEIVIGMGELIHYFCLKI